MPSKDIPRAEEFMTRNVDTVSPEMTLAELLDFLIRRQVSNAPVIETNDDGQPMLIGFISEGDCLEYLSNEMFFGNPTPTQTVRTMMKRHPVCVSPDTDVFTLASVFVNHRYRHLPVVEDGRLLGLVSRRDILQALDGYYQDTIHQKNAQKLPIDLHEIINLRFVSKGREVQIRYPRR